MGLVWRPGIWEDGASSWYPLPKPVMDLNIGRRWDRTIHKVEGADGDINTSPTKGPITIRARGVLSETGAGAMLIGNAAVDTEMQAFITAANGNATTRKYWFCVYYNSGDSYRFYKECETVTLDFGQAELMHSIPYVLVVKASDPVLYTAAAGNLA